MKKFWSELKKYFISAITFDGNPQMIELIIITALILTVGTSFYHFEEGWSVLDSLYFSVTTLTTVGYGDLTPTTGVSKFFTVIYILAGVGMLLGFVNTVAAHARDKSPLDRLFKKK